MIGYALFGLVVGIVAKLLLPRGCDGFAAGLPVRWMNASWAIGARQAIGSHGFERMIEQDRLAKKRPLLRQAIAVWRKLERVPRYD